MVTCVFGSHGAVLCISFVFHVSCRDLKGDTVTAWGINMNGHRRSKALRAAFLVNNEGTVVYNNVNFKARGSLRCFEVLNVLPPFCGVTWF